MKFVSEIERATLESNAATEGNCITEDGEVPVGAKVFGKSMKRGETKDYKEEKHIIFIGI